MSEKFSLDQLIALERELAGRPRPTLSPDLRARVLEKMTAERAALCRRWYWRAVSPLGAVAAVFLISAVIWSAPANVPASARIQSERIALELAATAERLKELGLSSSEAQRSALALYVDTKLPRLLIPKGPSMRPSDAKRQAEPSNL